VLIGTDCSQMSVVSSDNRQKTFILRVPNPRVISSALSEKIIDLSGA
jgi:hypothetical protein